MLKAVMFDLGGTLIDLGNQSAVSLGMKGAKRAYDELKQRGADLPGYVAYFGKVTAALSGMAMASQGLKEIDISAEIKSFFEGLGVTLSAEALESAVAAWYSAFSEQARLIEGTEAALAAVREMGLRMAIVSNSVWRGALIEKDLERLGIRGFFDAVVASSDVGYRKPGAAIMDEVLSRLDVQAGEAVMVGDSRVADVAAAQQAGMRSVLIENRPQQGPEPDVKIASIAELPGVIENMKA